MRIVKTILHALGGPGRQVCRRVAVFEPFEKDTYVAAAHVGREVRLCADHSAKRDEFVGSETITLVLLRTILQILISFGCFVSCVCPEVHARRAFVAWSNAVAPVVLIGETSAGVTYHARF